MRPDDDEHVTMVESLRWQQGYVADAGSPVAALILDAVANDLEAAGPVADVLPAKTRFGDFLGLRVMAAVHLMALERQAPAVALCLPTLGGAPPTESTDVARFQRDVVAARCPPRTSSGSAWGAPRRLTTSAEQRSCVSPWPARTACSRSTCARSGPRAA